MSKQDVAFYKHAKYTKKELLSIFKVEAQSICKNTDEVSSIAESTLSDFIKNHSKYTKLG